MIIRSYRGKTPRLAEGVFLAPGSVVIGDVTIGEGSSVWYNTVVRGDVGQVTIGRGTNIQDLCVLHMTTGVSNLVIGDQVTVGHRVVLHGCTIEDRCLIGTGAVVLDNAVIGAGSVVASGAVVLERTVVPPNSLVTGVPAKVRKSLTGEEQARALRIAARYHDLAKGHRAIYGPAETGDPEK